jgi:hypothetical protein
MDLVPKMNIVRHMFSRILLGLVIVLFITSLFVRVQVRADESPGSESETESSQSTPAPAAPAKEPDKVEVVVAVDVPANANARDQFVLSPFPLKPPDATDADFCLPTNEGELKELLKSAVLYKASTPGEHPPDWRVDRALQLGLRRSRKHMPLVSQGLDQWLDEFFPVFQQEVTALNADQKRRKIKFDTCGSHEQGRQAYRDDAANRGLTPISVRVGQQKRGIRQGTVFVKPAMYWVVGTHSMPGLTYYWQEQRTIQAGMARMVELTEANAAFIKGHF